MITSDITSSPELFATKYDRLQREKTELKRELETKNRLLKSTKLRYENERTRNQNLMRHIEKLEFARRLNEPSTQDLILKKAKQVFEAIQTQYPCLEWSDIISRRRHRDVTEARQLLVYFLRIREKYTFKAAGNIINRDHTTCIHALTVIEDLKSIDRRFAAKFTEIEKNLPNFVKNK